MIKMRIEMGDDHVTYVSGNTIEQCLYELKDYNTLTDFERDHYAKRGKKGCAPPNSPWYWPEHLMIVNEKKKTKR
jgi:hypothetical protein